MVLGIQAERTCVGNWGGVRADDVLLLICISCRIASQRNREADLIQMPKQVEGVKKESLWDLERI